MMSHPRKILIIKLRKLGDVIATTPVTRQLRNLYPNAEITFLTEPLGAKVYENSNQIDRLLIIRRKSTISEYLKLCYNIYKEKFNLVIDLYHHNKTAIISMLSFAKLKFGYVKSGKKSIAYNQVISLSHYDVTSVNSSLHHLKLTQVLGTNYTDTRIEFNILETTRKAGLEFAKKYNFSKKTIAYCVQSERDFAQVPHGLLVSIANYLKEKKFTLYFIYGPNEKEKAFKVYNAMNDKNNCIIHYEMPSVKLVRAILENCHMYVGNDGGNKHLAVTANICTIALFYGDNPKVWTPDEPNSHRYLQTRNNENAFEDFKEIFEKWDDRNKNFM